MLKIHEYIQDSYLFPYLNNEFYTPYQFLQMELFFTPFFLTYFLLTIYNLCKLSLNYSILI